jgi:hypothetical protein
MTDRGEPLGPGAMAFPFRFDPWFRACSLVFGITPSSSLVTVDPSVAEGVFVARFGPWRVRTTLANVVDTKVTGPYTRIKTMGSARLSAVDRGLTFASNAERGLCICFDEPVPGLLPNDRVVHPGLTVTVDDVEGLQVAIESGRRVVGGA